MNIEDVAQSLEIQIRRVCGAQSRYRVLWIIGAPRSGKTSLCQYICTAHQWKYVNFTLDPGYLDSLLGREETYRPKDFEGDLLTWCSNSKEEFIIFDEIEPLLGLWNREHQDNFFRIVGRIPELRAGVVLVTRIRSALQLRSILPEMSQDHIYEIEQE
ncbi:hypothetical protein KSD_30010 [Ktedonobacter sp. SOSP1-85]|uniref:hypothetical protein n=1 Tax=Ktedonobacter sp. SOSP1-85 TaxID=2778367 RepID=UPI001916A8EC|nr:hypothetical protein [Ktedonobacter sp. SOSP1-85]GHO75230.1 hypothetical protein KSD_30010 [Ktedonobacter sp. SOSP1-85]